MATTAPHVLGQSLTRSKRPTAFPLSVWGQVARGVGARLHLTDGRVLIDWASSLGATPLGHAHPFLTLVLKEQLDTGTLYTLPSVLEETAAEAICTHVAPWADLALFTKTGSEACAGAIRIARAATHRTRIATLRRHYHGWHDWHAVTSDPHPGVPESLGAEVDVFTPELLMDYLTSQRETPYAAIILEPITRWGGHSSGPWLHSLLNLAHAAGTLVIFDEMICGGRVALGGASEYFGLAPDLAVYGKALGGGLPLACIVGPASLMQHGEYISGTYNGEALALAACLAVLEVYATEGVVGRLWELGVRLQSLIEASRETAEVWVEGLPPMFTLHFLTDHEARMGRFVSEAARHGALFHPGIILPCAAIAEAEWEQTEAAVVAGLEAALKGES